MASSNNPDLAKTPKRRPTTSRKVRLVAKIGAGEASWISVTRPADEASESVKLSFKDQSARRKEAYEFDSCYDQNEDNSSIFSREVKPLIPGLLEGCNATVVALGARGSGKTSLIQGSSEKPGLAKQAIDEIIPLAEEKGCTITISSYEMSQDRIYDILDPSRPEVFVLGGGQGKIQLKGLSQVPVKSTSEFSKLYASCKKAPTKGPVELSRRCHKGLIVYLSSQKENSDSFPISKLNFIDLAGYEDTRRKSVDCVNQESTKINKSICALINVINVVSSKGNYVPYRENKLTHLLQDSLGGTSKVVIITCLKPSFCQDLICMVRLVARSSQNTNQAVIDSTKRSNNLTVSVVRSSSKCHLSMTASAIAKKQTSSRLPLSEKKVNGPLSCNKSNVSVAAASKGKKLFKERSHSTKLMKASATSNIVSAGETCVPDKEDSYSNVTEGPEQLKYGNPSANALHPMEPASDMQKDELLLDNPKDAEHTLNEEKECLILDESKHEEDESIAEKSVSLKCDGPHTEDNNLADSSSAKNDLALDEVNGMEKVDNNFPDNEVASPPISAKLQELALKMKSLCSSAPLSKMPEDNDTSANYLVCTGIIEPKTPVASQKNVGELANINSPWEALSVRSASIKHSLVQEYLSFLNTASKEELKRLKGIGEKKATYILDCRVETPEPFKSLDDLQEIGLSGKLVKNMMKSAGGLFD